MQACTAPQGQQRWQRLQQQPSLPPLLRVAAAAAMLLLQQLLPQAMQRAYGLLARWQVAA